MVSLKVMNPRAERRLVKRVGLSNPRMDDLNGKKIALLCVKGDFHLNCGFSPLSLLKGASAEILLHIVHV